jgi:hypothetical protein
LYLFKYVGEESDLASMTYAFNKSFDGFNMIKVSLCETYSSIPEDDDNEHGPLTIIALEFDLNSSIRSPAGALKTIDIKMQSKAESCQLEWLRDWTFDDLYLYW